MDFYVVMGRPGMRVAERKQKKARIGHQHKVRPEDTVSWFKTRFDGIVARVGPPLMIPTVFRSRDLPCPHLSFLSVNVVPRLSRSVAPMVYCMHLTLAYHVRTSRRKTKERKRVVA